MNPFSDVLLRISNDLRPDDVQAMKFLCPDIGKRKLEKINSGIDLFQCLLEMNIIGPDNTQSLRKLLTSIKRADLLEILSNFETYGPGQLEVQLDPNVREKLDMASDLLADQLGRNWRKYGRKLGISDVKLEQIEERYPKDLQGRAVGLLREWRKVRGAEATVEELISALRSCDLNLTADQLYRKLTGNEG